MQARYFDPIIGRFLSPDPVGYEDQLNLYAYVGNDPLDRTDPTGKFNSATFGRYTLLAVEEDAIGGGPLDPIADVFAIGTIVVGLGVAAFEHDQEIKADSNKERVEATDKAEGIDRTSSVDPRPGKDFTKKGKEIVKSANRDAHGGTQTCESCGVATVPAKQSKKGVTPPGNETHIDHKDPKSKGGSGSPPNGQVLCRDCNLEKRDRR